LLITWMIFNFASYCNSAYFFLFMWLYGTQIDGLLLESSIQIRPKTTLKCKNMQRNKLNNQLNADIDNNRISNVVLNGMTAAHGRTAGYHCLFCLNIPNIRMI